MKIKFKKSHFGKWNLNEIQVDLLRKIAGSKSDPMTICQMLGIQTHELGEKTYQHIGTCENFEEDGIDK